MGFPECSFNNLALVFQLVIILLSFLFSLTTIAMIVLSKLYMNSFTLIILIIQSCYGVMAIIDLLTKATTLSQNVGSVWCQVVGPFIYGAIFSSFVLMELFVLMIFQTISKKEYGWINKYVKQITFSIIIGSVVINCVGIPFYSPGFCNSCGFHKESVSHYEQFVSFVIGVDYYLPILLVIPVSYLMIVLILRRRRGELDSEQTLSFKVFLIPILNFVILIVNMNSGLGYVFIFDSVYFVSIVNFIFYRCFISFFELGTNTEVKECCSFQFLREKREDSKEAELMYPYVNRESGS